MLSCQTCNRQAGNRIDKPAIEALTQEHDGTLTTSRGTISIKMGLTQSQRIDRGLVTISHPSTDNRVYVRPTRNQQLPRPFPREAFRLSWRTRGRRSIEVGLLKAAYLAVFAIVGVEFAKANALRKVREQIAHPDEKLFDNFCLRSEKARGRAICLVHRKGRNVLGGNARPFSGTHSKHRRR